MSEAEKLTIDLTPSFQEAAAVCIAVIEHAAAETASGERSNKELWGLVNAAEQSKKELLRYAGELDRLKAAAAAAKVKGDTA